MAIKAGAIKCCKETKITALPNECRNIPLYVPKEKLFMFIYVSLPPQNKCKTMCLSDFEVLFPKTYSTLAKYKSGKCKLTWKNECKAVILN